MASNHRSTPEGTRDRLFEECAARRQVKATLRSLFTRVGYDEVETPALEFYDVFSQGAGIFPQENLFKLTDAGGRLIVMRPDNTTPIARLISMRLKDAPLPLRLYYDQPVYRMTRALSGRSLEMHQMGVELIGPSTYRADLQVLMLAARCLESQGGAYRLEICDIGFFKAIMNTLDVDAEERDALRNLVAQKNSAALREALRSFTESPAKRALLLLPELYGGEEALSNAEALLPTPGAKAALDGLRNLYRDLSAMGLSDKIAIDLGVVHQAEYYTGVIFRGYMDGIGEAVLQGGRYDDLIQTFGRPLCAIGFGVNTDLLAERQLVSGESDAVRKPARVLIHPEEGCDAEAFAYMAKKAEEGTICEMSVCDTIGDALEWAKVAGICALHIIAKDGGAAIHAIGEPQAEKKGDLHDSNRADQGAP